MHTVDKNKPPTPYGGGGGGQMNSRGRKRRGETKREKKGLEEETAQGGRPGNGVEGKGRGRRVRQGPEPSPHGRHSNLEAPNRAK